MDETPLDNLISLLCSNLKELNDFVNSQDYEVDISDPAIQSFLNKHIVNDVWLNNVLDNIKSEQQLTSFIQHNPLFKNTDVIQRKYNSFMNKVSNLISV